MSDTNRGRVAYIAESAFGVTPDNPDFQILRLTSSDLAYNKETTQSNELDSSRMLVDVPEVGVSTGGSLSIEWSAASYDELIEAALGGTRSTKVSLENNLSIVVGSGPTVNTSVLTDDDANGDMDDLEEGQWVLLSGWTAPGNNGWFEVSAVNVNGNEITLRDPGGKMVNATGGAATGEKLTGQTMKNGVVSRSFSFEESYLDVFMYRLFNGLRVSTMAMDLSTGSIATGSFGLMGTNAIIEAEVDASTEPSWLGSGVRAPAGTTKVLNATSNVGDILIDGVISTACFQSLNLNLDNTLRSLMCIGKKFPTSINYGRQTISGSISNLFANWNLYEKMMNHEDVALSFGLVSPGGEGGIHIYLPRVTLSSDNVNLSGGVDSDVQESIDWSALKHADDYQIRVDIAS